MLSSTVSWSYFKLRHRVYKSRRAALTLAIVLGLVGPVLPQSSVAATPSALQALNHLTVKGRAPKTGYERNLFSDGWGQIGYCDLRNYILKRDLVRYQMRASEPCTVQSGTLKDPYTRKSIAFVRGVATSYKVQIDHVVAVSDAWQKGAQKIGTQARYSFYNDPLNLLAVDGPTNSAKSDSDAASWLPPNKSFRCSYVARQIAVKTRYHLWVTSAERSAMARVLGACPTMKLPTH